MSSAQKFERRTFVVSRELEYFSESELEMQIGHAKPWWRVAVLKELIDNALDACETANTAPPCIGLTVDDAGFEVRDNGPGMPAETVKRALDYSVRVSDKVNYISPTRGQLGNALKVVFAAPFVATGGGRVEIHARGVRHAVGVMLDRLEGRPEIGYECQKDGSVKTGTRVRVDWDSACSPGAPEPDDFYKPAVPPTVRELVEGYAAFNPHATFRLDKAEFLPTDRDWRRWLPSDPAVPHWYGPESFRDLVAAYIASERYGQAPETVRAFVAQFRGLSGTAKQKAVTRGLKGSHLHDLVQNGDVDAKALDQLLERMKTLSRPPKPAALGIIGKDHLTAWLVGYAGVSEKSIKYRKVVGQEEGLPWVVEVAFGVRENDDAGRRIVTGLNSSPTLLPAAEEIQSVVAQMRLDPHDPVTLVVHLARPRFEFVERGKGRVAI